MKYSILIALLVLSSFSLSAQEKHVLTEEQNTRWLQELQQADGLEAQLQVLRERLTSDKDIYYKMPQDPHGKAQGLPEGFKAATRFRPLYVFTYPEGRLPLYMNPSGAYLDRLLEILRYGQVSAITALTGVRATAIYGSRAFTGVIELRVAEKDVVSGLMGLQ